MITLTERLDKALRVAADAHEKQGQHRKGSGAPYIIHPFGVMLIASNATTDEDVLIACLLHDVLEDVSPDIYSRDDMLRDFGQRVIDLVSDVTKNPNLKVWRECAVDYLNHLEHKASEGALIVSAADKIHNLESVIIDYRQVGEELWQIFTTKNADDQLWWYGAILKVLQKRQAPQSLQDQLAQGIKILQDLRATRLAQPQ